MPLRPRKLSKAPVDLEVQDPHGDVLADVLGATLLPNALYKRVEARAPWGMRIRKKPRASFYVVARGAALLEVDGQKPVMLSAGDAAFLPHGTAHSLRDSNTSPTTLACEGPPPLGSPRRLGGNGAPCSIIAGFFQREHGATPVLLERMPEVVVVSQSSPTADPWLSTTLQLLLAESATSGPASTFVLHRLVDVLFVQALRSLSRREECPRGLPALSDPPIYQALSLMHGDVRAPWTVAKLAKLVGLSRSGFAARFTERVGEPPLQYLVRWRVARASELLRDTNDTVAQIAARVGYESVPSFSKAFKRWRDMSPAAFRRALRAPSPTVPSAAE